MHTLPHLSSRAYFEAAEVSVEQRSVPMLCPISTAMNPMLRHVATSEMYSIVGQA